MSKLEEVLLQDVPLIPVTEQVDWDEYNTAHIGGWPTAPFWRRFLSSARNRSPLWWREEAKAATLPSRPSPT